MTKNNLVLLMPAGSYYKMQLALDYGADAVYLGPPLFSLRARENHFEDEELARAINYVHEQNKKVYMTLNIFSRNRKLKPFTEAVVKYAAMKPDAFIISDPGLASIAKEQCPEIPIHLSVQANCMNWKSVEFWKKSLGIERVILSRELSIQEISEIKQRVPDMELEAFVHGSICIAYSGRCLLSSYMDKRDANQGVCDNSCRQSYKVHEKEYFLEDSENLPGQLYEIDEDEHGTYILNAQDLCMVDHLDQLIKAGVISFKVEGRTKSEYYAAKVARAYRGALNDCEKGFSIQDRWRQELNQLTNRGYHTAFMLGEPRAEGQNYKSSMQYHESIKLVGFAKSVKNLEASSYEVKLDVKHKVSVGQTLMVQTQSQQDFKVKVKNIILADGQQKNEVHSGVNQVILWLEVVDQREQLKETFFKERAMLVSDVELLNEAHEQTRS